MSFQRGIDGPDPMRAQPVWSWAGAREERDDSHSWRLASGTLACPRCDAPVGLAGRAVSLAEDLDCPFCRHAGAVRDFLSLESPSRPARVEVRVRSRARVARH